MKTALDLRIALVREVARPKFQATLIEQQLEGLNDGITKIESDRKKFREALAEECLNLLDSEMLTISSMEIEAKNTRYLDDTSEKLSELRKKAEELKIEVTSLKIKAREAAYLIVNRIIVGDYGRGEITLNHGEGLCRIFGRIEELNEPAFYSDLVFSMNHRQIDVERVAQMCEQQKQTPPLIHIAIDLMPLDEEELRSLCFENDDYKLIAKYVPAASMLWNRWSPYCIERNSLCEIYLLSLDDEKIAIVKLDKLNFPHFKLTVLGKVSRSEETMLELLHWNGVSELHLDQETASAEQVLTLSIVAKHIFQKHYPGVIIELPQIEVPTEVI